MVIFSLHMKPNPFYKYTTLSINIRTSTWPSYTDIVLFHAAVFMKIWMFASVYIINCINGYAHLQETAIWIHVNHYITWTDEDPSLY
jgi:hypothetical protein